LLDFSCLVPEKQASKQAGKQASSQPSMAFKILGTFKFLLIIGIKNWRSGVQGCGIKGARDQEIKGNRKPDLLPGLALVDVRASS